MGAVPEPRTMDARWESDVKGIPPPKDYNEVKNHRNIMYYDINLKNFVDSKLEDKFLAMFSDYTTEEDSILQQQQSLSSSSSSSPPSSPANATTSENSISKLKYDEESISIIMSLFGLYGGMPSDKT